MLAPTVINNADVRRLREITFPIYVRQKIECCEYFDVNTVLLECGLCTRVWLKIPDLIDCNWPDVTTELSWQLRQSFFMGSHVLNWEQMGVTLGENVLLVKYLNLWPKSYHVTIQKNVSLVFADHLKLMSLNLLKLGLND